MAVFGDNDIGVNPMAGFKRLVLSAVIGCLLLPSWGQAQNVGVPGSANNFSFLGDLSVVGSDGILYRAASVSEASGGSRGVPSSPGSKLEALNLDPNSKDPFAVLYFSGSPTHLAIGRDNRLILTALLSPIFPFTDSTGTPLPQPSLKTNLFIIPTPFASGRLAGPTLEPIAPEANLTRVVQLELEGIVNSLQVKLVGNRELLYIVTTNYSLPLVLGPSTGSAIPEGTSKIAPKLTILDSDGNRIKVTDLK